jgi:MFS superfamily sulfate permease-like transporter
MHMGDMESIDASCVWSLCLRLRPRACLTDCFPDTLLCSALAIFSELAKSYRARGVSIYFTHLRPAQRELFTRAGLVEFLGAANFQPSVEGAISSIEDRGLSSGLNSQ